MELSTKNNIWLFLHRMWTGKAESLPNTICPLFWGGIMGFFTIILSPLLMLVMLIIWAAGRFKKPFLEIRKSTANNGITLIAYNIVITFFFLMFSIMGLNMMGYADEQIHTAPWYLWTFAWTFMPLIATTVLSVIWGIVMLYENRPRKTYKEKKQPSVVSQGLKDFYNRYCTRIEWKK